MGKRNVYKILSWNPLTEKWTAKKISSKKWHLWKIRFKNDARLNDADWYTEIIFEKTVAGYHFRNYNVFYGELILECYLTKEEA